MPMCFPRTSLTLAWLAGWVKHQLREAQFVYFFHFHFFSLLQAKWDAILRYSHYSISSTCTNWCFQRPSIIKFVVLFLAMSSVFPEWSPLIPSKNYSILKNEKLQSIQRFESFQIWKRLRNFQRFDCSTPWEFLLISPDSIFVANWCDNFAASKLFIILNSWCLCFLWIFANFLFHVFEYQYLGIKPKVSTYFSQIGKQTGIIALKKRMTNKRRSRWDFFSHKSAKLKKWYHITSTSKKLSIETLKHNITSVFMDRFESEYRNQVEFNSIFWPFPSHQNSNGKKEIVVCPIKLFSTTEHFRLELERNLACSCWEVRV